MQEDDGPVAAHLTEHTCPAATELGMTVLRGVQQQSFYLGLRRDSHLTGQREMFLFLQGRGCLVVTSGPFVHKKETVCGFPIKITFPYNDTAFSIIMFLCITKNILTSPRKYP